MVKNIAYAPVPPQVAPEVTITPDGAYALLRSSQPSVGVLSLADGARVDVPLPGVPTDLDLSADGSAAVAVIRETSQVALLPVPAVFTNPAGVTLVTIDTTVGSTALAAQSATAFFYTNATPSPLLAVMDTQAAAPAARLIKLRAPVLAVFPTADGSHALVLHDALIEAGSHYPAAFSVAPIALDLPPKIVGLEAPVISIALAPAGDHGLVATGDPAKSIYQLVVASMPSLSVQKLSLASMPIAAGIVAGADRGFVAQKHPRRAHHLRQPQDRRGPHPDRVRARHAGRRRQPMNTLAPILRSLTLASLFTALLPGCGARDAVWDAPPSGVAAHALQGSAAFVDVTADRVLLTPVEQDLTFSPVSIPMRRGFASSRATPDGSALLVLARGDVPREKPDDQGPGLAMIDGGTSPRLLLNVRYLRPALGPGDGSRRALCCHLSFGLRLLVRGQPQRALHRRSRPAARRWQPDLAHPSEASAVAPRR